MKINKEKFKKLLYLNGLTQKALADKLNTNIGVIYAYAQGKKTPRAKRAERLANILNCKIEDFIEVN